MKFILVLAVVMIGIWLWRSGRQGSVTRDRPKSPPSPADPQEMVSCQLCSLHFPSAEAVTGRLGLYCCKDHLQRAEP
jgi:uncharacterized protein